MSKATTQAVKTQQTLVKTQMDAICKGLETKSAKIRALHAKDYTRPEIAKYLGIRYQHVRNVLITPLVGKKPVQ